MRRMYLIIGALLVIFIIPHTAWGIGFLQESIWTSKKTFFAGETIRIYIMLVNQENRDVKGTVAFLVNGQTLGTESFTLTVGTNNTVLWYPWKVVEGNVQFGAEIRDAYTIDSSGARIPVAIENPVTAKPAQFVDRDSDGDGIGDIEDPDDDNDGIPDTTETSQGTNPKSADTDGDTVPDSEDRAPTNPAIGRAPDTDGDGVANDTDSDDDNDGLYDHEETAFGSDPLTYDTDGDGLSDREERDAGTNPKKRDTDDDGVSDRDEVRAGTNPVTNEPQAKQTPTTNASSDAPLPARVEDTRTVVQTDRSLDSSETATDQTATYTESATNAAVSSSPVMETQEQPSEERNTEEPVKEKTQNGNRGVLAITVVFLIVLSAIFFERSTTRSSRSQDEP